MATLENKPINFVLRAQKARLGKNAGKTVVVATPTGRDRISYSRFCEEVGRNTSYNRREIQAVLDMAFDVAKLHVENGDIVQFGEFGMLTPSFKSQQVLLEDGQGLEVFDAVKHIDKPMVKLRPSRKYFTLQGVKYQRVEAGKSKKPKTEQGGGGSQGRGEDLGI